MLIVWFLSIKSSPNLLFGVLCLPGDQSHPFAQPTITLLRVASAGLVYWVVQFFLLGTKARILGLTRAAARAESGHAGQAGGVRAQEMEALSPVSSRFPTTTRGYCPRMSLLVEMCAGLWGRGRGGLGASDLKLTFSLQNK